MRGATAVALVTAAMGRRGSGENEDGGLAPGEFVVGGTVVGGYRVHGDPWSGCGALPAPIRSAISSAESSPGPRS